MYRVDLWDVARLFRASAVGEPFSGLPSAGDAARDRRMHEMLSDPALGARVRGKSAARVAASLLGRDIGEAEAAGIVAIAYLLFSRGA